MKIYFEIYEKKTSSAKCKGEKSIRFLTYYLLFSYKSTPPTVTRWFMFS